MDYGSTDTLFGELFRTHLLNWKHEQEFFKIWRNPREIFKERYTNILFTRIFFLLLFLWHFKLFFWSSFFFLAFFYDRIVEYLIILNSRVLFLTRNVNNFLLKDMHFRLILYSRDSWFYFSRMILLHQNEESHLGCYSHEVSPIVLFGFLEVFIIAVNFLWISNGTLYSIQTV